MGGPNPVSEIYLDTHTAVVLHAGALELLGDEGKRRIEGGDLLISPMVLLELDHLHAARKIRYDSTQIFTALNATLGVSLCSLPFSDVAHEALGITWTRDPFDRIIVAQAKIRNSPLVTRDREIRLHYPKAVW